jgi:hypothetical protein
LFSLFAILSDAVQCLPTFLHNKLLRRLAVASGLFYELNGARAGEAKNMSFADEAAQRSSTIQVKRSIRLKEDPDDPMQLLRGLRAQFTAVAVKFSEQLVESAGNIYSAPVRSARQPRAHRAIQYGKIK